MIGINARNQEIALDWEDGPSPMEVTLQMVGACSLVDVVIGLKEREFTEVWVECDAERAETTLRVFTEIKMKYHIKGNVPLKLAQRIVEKSHDKYCSVSNMLNEKVIIQHEVILHDLD